MGLIVQKFGGSSVKNAERIFNVAKIVTDTYSAGNDVIVVVSAQGDTTDDLLDKAHEISARPSKRELDVLLSAGEQISSSLLAMAIEKMGYNAVSLTGWQAGFLTDRTHSNARIRRIETERLRSEIEKRKIVIVAGFQGINRNDDISTLGRGGSDTSAVAIAAAMKADICQIYTDVDGVYTADPRIVKSAIKLEEITYDEMLELSSLGAQVLHNRSVEMAKKFDIKLEVLSSLTKAPGTMVKEVTKMEKMLVKGIARDDHIVKFTIKNLQNVPGIAFKIFSAIAGKKINVDIIVQTAANSANLMDMSFTTHEENAELAQEVLGNLLPGFGNGVYIERDDDLSKVSVVGSGMQTNAGIAARMFETLADNQININTISTSEIKISVLIARVDSTKAVVALHDSLIQ
ncbi:MAG: aspartate kinase [Oscillospiraceae bacterium]|jgi:aspartate kinase|nr:aspartate kinase [Oscillospiraceae bacterium]